MDDGCDSKFDKDAEFNSADGEVEAAAAAAANHESSCSPDDELKCILDMNEFCDKLVFSEEMVVLFDKAGSVEGGLTGECGEGGIVELFTALLSPFPH